MHFRYTAKAYKCDDQYKTRGYRGQDVATDQFHCDRGDYCMLLFFKGVEVLELLIIKPFQFRIAVCACLQKQWDNRAPEGTQV